MIKRLLTLSVFLSVLSGAYAQSGWQVRIMPQLAFGAKNDVQRPNDETGTRFSLNDDFNRKNDASFSPRVELEYNINRHHIIAAAAWLTDRFEGAAPNNIRFDEVSFNRGDHVDAIYRFNTYRLGYRYRIVERPQVRFELGATILLRDAFISLESGTNEGKFTNVGVAPLLSYYVEWMALESFSLLSYGDALAMNAGRAEDIFAGLKCQFSPSVSAMAGYRLLEGGSDNDSVYTISMFHFLSLGVGINF